MSQRTLVVLQPGYLPWLGFFDQLKRADVFVLYDDVQFDKHGWRNRNRIRSGNDYGWLSVPVLHKGRFGQRICEVEIDNTTPWGKKHLGVIRQCYSKAPHFDAYFSGLSAVLSDSWTSLSSLNHELLSLLSTWLDIYTPVYRASELAIPGKKTERLVNLCHHFQADTYLSGNAAQAYLDVERFQTQGIKVEWQDYQHPVYVQQGEGFLPFLSVIDVLFNLGEGSKGVFGCE